MGNGWKSFFFKEITNANTIIPSTPVLRNNDFTFIYKTILTEELHLPEWLLQSDCDTQRIYYNK